MSAEVWADLARKAGFDLIESERAAAAEALAEAIQRANIAEDRWRVARAKLARAYAEAVHPDPF